MTKIQPRLTAQQLKSSILQMAVEGKLVPQDTKDEPASVLLEKIRMEKKRLVKEGKIKQEKPLPPINEDEVPLDLPMGWKWVRLEEVSVDIHYGYTASANIAGNSKLLRITDIQNNAVSWDNVPFCTTTKKEFETYGLNNRDIMIARTGGTIGKSYIVRNLNEKAVFASYLIRVIPLENVYEEYLKLFLESPLYWGQLKDSQMGTGQPNVNGQALKALILPLPPLTEQKRIAAKIEELLPLVEAYDKVEQKLTTLNVNFPELLKKAVLQDAVQGKLVPQDPKDEPANVLLERIRTEKKRLVKEGKKGAEKPLPPINENEIPYDLPKGWEWVRLGEIVFNHGQMMPKGNFCYIDIGSIDNTNQRLNEQETVISASKAPSRARKIVETGDILYATVRPYLHNMCIIDRKFSKTPIASTGFAVMACYTGIFNRYLFHFLLSPDFDNYANNTDNSKGVAYPAINDDRLYKACVPLPPLAEQKRIVAKINELLQWVDQLEVIK